MRQSGPKGFPQPRRGNVLQGVEDIEPLDNLPSAFYRQWFTTSGDFSEDAGFMPNYESISQLIAGQGPVGFTLDFGFPRRLAWAAMQSENWTIDTTSDPIEVQYSHDNVVWRDTPKDDQYRSVTDDGNGSINHIGIFIKQPVPEARYWRVRKYFVTPETGLFMKIDALRVGTYEPENVLTDTIQNEWTSNGSTNLDFSHSAGAAYIGRSFYCGWTPDVVWAAGAEVFTSGPSMGIEFTDRSALTELGLSRDPAGNEKIDVTQRLKTGFTIGPQNDGTQPKWSTWSWNDRYSDTSDDGFDQSIWAWRNDPKNGTAIRNVPPTGAISSTHSLPLTPDFVILEGLWGNEVQVVMHRDAPVDSLRTGNTAPSTWALDGLSWDANNVNHLPATSTVRMMAFINVTGVQHFGTYTGNGNVSGPSVVDPGFTPDLLMLIKNKVADTQRAQVYDRVSRLTYANGVWSWGPSFDNAADWTASGPALTLTASGFDVASTDVAINESGVQYLYAAWKM